MKKFNILLVLMFFGTAIFAQTNPSAVSLPYSQDFSSLTHNSSTYPSGWQGWQVTTSLSSSFNTSAPTADKVLTASSSASTTSGNVHNYNGKTGFLNSGSSGDLSLVLVVNTTGKSNIQVKYDAMTIRNPYDGGSNTRVNEMTLQYRLGTTGTFTSLSGIEYQNNTTQLTTSGSTTPQNVESKSITLPSSCNNEAVVQLRWISRQVSGAGSRPSFAIDNISVSEAIVRSLVPLAAANAAESSVPSSGSFSFTFSPACTTSTTFDYVISGNASFNTDYTVSINGAATPSTLTSSSGTITVPSATSSIVATILPVNDNVAEGSETIVFTISNASDNYIINDASETIFISDDDPAFIHDIQGSGNTATPGSNLIEAIVTGVFPSLSPAGFYVQEEDADADANPNTSEGIFIVSSSPVAVGDKVRISGTVSESGSSPSFSQAVMFNTSVSVLSSGNSLPSFVNIDLPLNAVSDFEKFECMLVNFTDQLTVTENFNLGRFGEIRLSEGGLVYQPTQLIDPNDAIASGTNASGSSNVAAINALAFANSVRTILLDDGTGSIVKLPYVDSSNNLRIGSLCLNLKGIMGYGFSNYRIQPIPSDTPVFVYAPRPVQPGVGVHNIKMCSFNVLNYFNGDGQGGGFPTSRGAHSVAEFNRQRAKIINAIAAINADVVGLTEIENDGTDSNSAIADLVDGLNSKLGSGTYDYILDGQSIQSFGTDAIRCAIIYKTATVKPLGRALLSSATVFSRPALAQTFTALATCSDFSYVINHFKSKSASGASGADVDQLDGQSAYNDKRKQQSVALADFIRDSVIAISGSDRVISMGDYNAYYEEDPLDILRDSGYTVLGTASSYSYQFNGQLGSLDHALVNSNLLTYVSGVAKWNLNADEPTHLGYDDNINDGSGDFVNKWSSTYSSIPFRSSDHDPVIVGINFPSESPVASISTIPSSNVYTGGIPTNIYLGYGAQSDTLKASANGGSGFTFTWSPATNLSCTACEQTVFTPSSPGSYTYKLTATSDKGCKTTSTVQFCVRDVRVAKNNSSKIYICHEGKTNEISVSAVQAHLKNHDDDLLGRCDDSSCGSNSHSGSKRSLDVSSSQTSVSAVSVYPNPINGLFYISLPSEMEQAYIVISDMSGRVVLKKENASGLLELSSAEMKAGVYLIRVQSAEESYYLRITVL